MRSKNKLLIRTQPKRNTTYKNPRNPCHLWMLLPLLCLPQIAFTQNTLELLLYEATHDHLQHQILETEYKAALEKAPQVSQLPDLNAYLGGFPLPLQTHIGPQLIRTGAQQMFPWFGTLDAKKDLALAKAEIKYEQIAMHSLELNYHIKQAYFDWYEKTRSTGILQRNITLLESLEHLALAKVESGEGSAADVLRVQMKRTELEQEIQILETTKRKPLAKLSALLNREVALTENDADSLAFAQMVLSKTAFLKAMEDTHPSLQIIEQQQTIAKQELELNKLLQKPKFGIAGDVTFIAADIEDAFAVLLRGMVQIPLNNKQYEAKAQEEKLKLKALSMRREDTLDQLFGQLEQAYADYDMAALQVDLYQKQLDLIDTSIHILESEYSATGKGFERLIELEKEQLDYELKLLKAIVKSHLANADVELLYDMRLH